MIERKPIWTEYHPDMRPQDIRYEQIWYMQQALAAHHNMTIHLSLASGAWNSDIFIANAITTENRMWEYLFQWARASYELGEL